MVLEVAFEKENNLPLMRRAAKKWIGADTMVNGSNTVSKNGTPRNSEEMNTIGPNVMGVFLSTTSIWWYTDAISCEASYLNLVDMMSVDDLAMLLGNCIGEIKAAANGIVTSKKREAI
jgi:hypothetical protein